MIDFTFNILKSNTVDWANIIAMILTGLLSAGVALWIAWRNNDKQFQMFKTQLEEQRKQWKNENLYKYRQDKLLELRKLYINFQINILDFFALFVPTSIGAGSLTPTADKALKYEYKTLKFYESPNSMVNRYCKSSNALCEFLKENDIFIQDKPELKEDIKALAETFQELFDKLQRNNDLDKLFIASPDCYTLIPNNHSFCKFFFKFMQWHLCLKRGERRVHVFDLYENSVFRINNLSFENKELDKWCSDIVVLFGTSAIFSTLLTNIKNVIDGYFVDSLTEIQDLSLNICDEQKEIDNDKN